MVASRCGGGGGHLFARYSTTERLDFLRTALAYAHSPLWLQATCSRRAQQSAGNATAVPTTVVGAGDRRGRRRDEDDDDEDRDDDVDIVPKANDPVDDGIGWLLRTVRNLLVTLFRGSSLFQFSKKM